MSADDRYALVAVSGPPRRAFVYRIPDGIERLQPGQRLLVPFGRLKRVGYYLEPATLPHNLAAKDIVKVLDDVSHFSTEVFKFCLWMSDYYFANPADCLAAALPSILRTHKKVLLNWGPTEPQHLPASIAGLARPGKKLSEAVISHLQHGNLLSRLVRDGVVIESWPTGSPESRKHVEGYAIGDVVTWNNYWSVKDLRPEPFEGVRTRSQLRQAGLSDYRITKAVKDAALQPIYDERAPVALDFIGARENVGQLVPNEEQAAALSEVAAALSGGFQVFLLHGVTGSGKTLVYCHLCREVVKADRTALVLTPEIALSGSMLAYFRGFFGDRVTVLHSAMSERERLESWRGIRQGRFRVVVGPRSAIFAPLTDLALVIVDEEHDGSYKQDSPSPRFHGRDAAIMRAKLSGAPVLLGSASPSLESYHNACSGRYRLLKLTSRPAGASLPAVRIVDMRTQRLGGDMAYLSYPLKTEVERRLKVGEQTILYLNRRGHSPMVKCADCGHVPACPHCHIKLTYHRIGRKLSCHYCGHLVTTYESCENCRGREFLYLGVGTQKIEEHLPRLFASARTYRLDSDAASGRRTAYTILTEFAQNKGDLLLGTQMVTKGLDLPNVTLVGVLSADLALDLPDFRASERAFAQLLQVAGRAGRTSKAGEVLIQTYYPDSEIIGDAARQDYGAFFEKEIVSRRELAYPPFARLANVIISGKDETKVEAASTSFRIELDKKLKTAAVRANPLGPAPCPFHYLRGQYRRQVLVKTNQLVRFIRMLTAWEEARPHFGLPSSVRVTVDVDPHDMM